MSTANFSMEALPPEALIQVAGYFRMLSEPTRLHILSVLRSGDRNVSELAQLIGTSPANTSRHLALLAQHGLVARTSRGNNVHYAIADQSVYDLCDLVCGNIASRFQQIDAARVNFVALASRGQKSQK